MNIDIRTLAFIMGFAAVIQVIALYLQYLLNKTYRGTGWWLLWSASTAAGFLCMLLRDIVPVGLVSVSILFTNVLLLAGQIFFYIGIMRFLDKKENRGIIIAVFSVFILSTVYVLYVNKDDNARTLIFYASAAIFLLLAAQGLFVNKTRSFTASANFICAVLFTQGCYFAVRSVAAATIAPMDSVFTPTLIQTASFLVSITAGSLCTFGLIIMVNQRLNTDNEKDEELLRQSEEKFRLLIENSHDIIYTLTPEGVFTFVSPSWTTLLGHPVNQVAGHPFQPFVHPDDLPGCLVWLQKVIETGQRQEGIEYRVRHIDGSWRWHTSSAVPLRDKDGTVIGFEGTARDITERRQMVQKLEEMATHDALTGLPNRTLFYDRCSIALANAQRNKKMLVVMTLDLDLFKDVNDRLGHDMGDKVLIAVAGRLTGSLRKSDTVSRMGGDEFVLLLWEIDDKDAAVIVAEKMLNDFRQPFLIDGHSINVTVSIGIAIFPENGDNMEELLKCSDKLLYTAKQNGGDRFAI